MNRTTLIISHAVTLLLGVGIAYLMLPTLSKKGPEGAGTGVTTFSGNTNSGGSTTSPGDFGNNREFDDHIGALESAKNIRSKEKRQLFTEEVYTSWAGKDGLKAANWVINNLKGTEKSDALFNIADGWGEADPQAAAKWFDTNTSGVNREDSIYQILESWGTKTPQNALKWAESLDDYTRSGVMDALAKGWAAKDPAAAAKASESLLKFDFGDEFVMAIAGQWASTDPKDAAAWSSTIENADARATAFLEVGSEWAMTEPGQATDWIKSLETDDDKLYASLGVALGWSEHDPGNALEWTLSNVDSESTRQRIIEDVMLNWSSNDPNSVGKWLNAQPNGPESDEILSTFSSAIIDIDPESAVTWAATISDEGKRSENLKGLLEEWIAMDGDRARKWVDDSNLNKGLKDSFGSTK